MPTKTTRKSIILTISSVGKQTYPVVNVSTIFADPFSLPILFCFGCFCFSRRRRFFVAKHVQGCGRTQSRYGNVGRRSHLKGIHQRKGGQKPEQENKKQRFHHYLMLQGQKDEIKGITPLSESVRFGRYYERGTWLFLEDILFKNVRPSHGVV